MSSTAIGSNASCCSACEARPFRAGGYRERTHLMGEIRREGIDF
jgi:hypothetical protein